jgi:hypothetical protein
MIERWLVAIRDHPERPAPAQCHVLTMLALRMDWTTGSGFASILQLTADATASKATVKRATKWARDTGFLIQTRRGHRIDAERSAASEWQLTQGLTPEPLEYPRAQNGRPKGSMKRPKGSPQTPLQESVVLQESSPSARRSRADAPRDSTQPCASCGRVPRSGHLPGCPEDGQP